MCGMTAASWSAASGVRWARATARAATRSRACENYMIGRHGRRRECEAWRHGHLTLPYLTLPYLTLHVHVHVHVTCYMLYDVELESALA